jgi:multiple sugar transport system substrate-binding protein
LEFRKSVSGRLVLMTALGIAALSGCSKGDQGQSGEQGAASTPVAGPTQPVTVKIAGPANWFPEQEWNDYFIKPVQAKYPNIKVELTNVPTNTDANWDALVASGIKPDIVIGATVSMIVQGSRGLLQDMEPLLKKHKFDLSRIDDAGVQSVKLMNGGTLAGIPFTVHFGALYYNRDLFDKFGVSYPKDGMTWEDARELAKKVTRKDGDVNYYGLTTDNPQRVASMLSLPLVNPATLKANVSNDAWKRVFETLKSIYDIPGNWAPPGAKTLTSEANFREYFQKGQLAMLVGQNWLDLLAPQNTSINWDLAGMPTFKEAPGKGFRHDSWYIAVSKTSSNPDAAYYVLETLLSDEVQTQFARNARLMTIKNESLRKEFGANLPYLKGKNLNAIYATRPVAISGSYAYENNLTGTITTALTNLMDQKVPDINTALRQAEDSINKFIDEQSKR